MKQGRVVKWVREGWGREAGEGRVKQGRGG